MGKKLVKFTKQSARNAGIDVSEGGAIIILAIVLALVASLAFSMLMFAKAGHDDNSLLVDLQGGVKKFCTVFGILDGNAVLPTLRDATTALNNRKTQADVEYPGGSAYQDMQICCTVISSTAPGTYAVADSAAGCGVTAALLLSTPGFQNRVESIVDARFDPDLGRVFVPFCYTYNDASDTLDPDFPIVNGCPISSEQNSEPAGAGGSGG